MNSNFSCRAPALSIFSVIITTLMTASLALAQAEVVPPAPSFGEVIGRMLPMFALVFFIFYFMVLKPQQKRMKEHEALVAGLKRGDAVVTSGGLMGRVAGVEKDCVLIELAAGVKVRVEPGHIAKKTDKVALEKAVSAA